MDNMSLFEALEFLINNENEEIAKQVAIIILSMPMKDLEEIMTSPRFSHHNQNHHN